MGRAKPCLGCGHVKSWHGQGGAQHTGACRHPHVGNPQCSCRAYLGRDEAPVSEAEALRMAVGSLLDVVAEMALTMEQGVRPTAEWVELVHGVLSRHGAELGFRS